MSVIDYKELILERIRDVNYEEPELIEYCMEFSRSLVNPSVVITPELEQKFYRQFYLRAQDGKREETPIGLGDSSSTEDNVSKIELEMTLREFFEDIGDPVTQKLVLGYMEEIYTIVKQKEGL